MSKGFSQTHNMRVLGIDPGYDRLGLAILERKDGKEKLIHSMCVLTSSKNDFHSRIVEIGESVKKIIKEYKPEEVSIEKTFFNKNKKTAISVSEARGVVVYEAARAKLPVFEYTPPEIKVAVTGYGGSDKKQVEMMVSKLISIKKDIKYDDEYDAIAVGLTHLAIRP